MIYIQLFLTFFVIGLFTIGGGYAMLSIIQGQVVGVHGWVDTKTFTDIVAVSQMTPGPIGVNCATYVGYSVLHETGASEFFCVLGSLSFRHSLLCWPFAGFTQNSPEIEYSRE